MSLEEAILDTVKRLPASLQERVLRFASGLDQSPDLKLVPSRDRSLELQWIQRNKANYENQWVVVEGDRLIASNLDPHLAAAAARTAGIEVPFLVHVLPDDPLPFVAGW